LIMNAITSIFISLFIYLSSTTIIPATATTNTNNVVTKRNSPVYSNLSIPILNGGEVSSSPKNKPKVSSLNLALSGMIATMIGDTALHPVDCIKTLQQSTEGAGLSLLGAGKKIFNDYGIAGFYSGLGLYVASDGCAGAIKFVTYEAMKEWTNDNVSEEYMGAAVFGCAAIAFVCSSVILVPGELIKQRLQMGQYNTVGGAIKSIWNTEGAMGFFTGYSGVCLRDIPYTMLELGLYENFKVFYLKLKNNRKGQTKTELSQFDIIAAAALTGGIAGYLTNPLDTIKTKLMVDGLLYKGFFDCARKSVAQNGVGSLFQGGAARVAWLAPFCGIYLPLYDFLKRGFDKYTFKVPTISMPSKANSGKGMKVKGGAQEGFDNPLDQERNPLNGLPMRMNRRYLKQQTLGKRISFISF